MLRVLLTVVLLTACSEAAQPTDKAAKKAARMQAAELALSKTPAMRLYRYDAGQLLIVEVPFNDGHGFVETQRCLLWRDTEFRTSTLQCPSGAGEALPDLVQ